MKKILAIAAMMLLGSSGAWALGTIAGISIDNNATLTFSAGGVVQPEVNASIGASGSADSFVVDKKIDMVLEINNADHIAGALGQANVVTSFAFKNEGNSNERFNFHVRNLSGGDSDNTDHPVDDTENVSDMVISCDYVDENGTASTATEAAGVDVLIFTQVDSMATCTVSATLPTGVPDGSVMNIELNATAYVDDNNPEVETGGAGDVDRRDTMDVVFADGVIDQTHVLADTTLGDHKNDDNASTGDNGDGAGEGDGWDVARNGYIIQTPDLKATKTSCVVSDPVNGAVANAKRIPGAVVRYMIDIENKGSGDVTDLNISDTLSTNFYDGTNIAIANVFKDENKTTCTCTSFGAIQVTHSENGMTTTLQGIGVAAKPAGSESHSCVSFEVEIK